MDSGTLLHTFLVLHIVGLVLAGGVSISNLIIFKELWAQYESHNPDSSTVFKTISKLQPLGMAGLMLLILSGISMLATVHWSFLSMRWLQLKLVLVVLIFVNGFTLGRTQALKLAALMSENKKKDEPADVALLRRNFRLFQLTQLSLVLLIVVLSIFKFN
jgi:hypothetical protein